MRVGKFVELIRDTFKEWSEDRAERLGAALAYYALFAFAPLLIIAISIAGLVFGEAAAKVRLSNRCGGWSARTPRRRSRP